MSRYHCKTINKTILVVTVLTMALLLLDAGKALGGNFNCTNSNLDQELQITENTTCESAALEAKRIYSPQAHYSRTLTIGSKTNLQPYVQLGGDDKDEHYYVIGTGGGGSTWTQVDVTMQENTKLILGRTDVYTYGTIIGTIRLEENAEINIENGTFTADSIIAGVDNGTITIAKQATFNYGNALEIKEINVAGHLNLQYREQTENLTVRTIDGTGTITASKIIADKITAKSITAKSFDVTNNVALTGGTFNLTDLADSKVGSLYLTGITGEVKGRLTLNGNSTLSRGTNMEFADLNINTHELSVGNSSSGVKGGDRIIIKKLTGAGDIRVNSAWDQPHGHAVTSDASVFTGNTMVFQNAMTSFGATDTTWLENEVNYVTENDGLTKNGVTAAFGLQKSYTIADSRGIMVDGSQTTAPVITANSAKFLAGSLLVVDAEGAATNAVRGAIHFASNSGTLNVADGAKLHLSNVKDGGNYSIVTGLSIINITDNGWGRDNLTAHNLSFDNIFFSGKLLTSDGTTVAVDVRQKKAADPDVLGPKLDPSLGGLVDAAVTAGIVVPDSSNPGQ